MTNTLSVAEFEQWCMLRCIPDEGCDLLQFTEHLGLALPLVHAVLLACQPLADAGQITVDSDGFVRLTATGRKSRDDAFSQSRFSGKDSPRSLPPGLH